MFDFIDCNKNGSITIVEFMTTMDDLGEADDYGKKIFTLFEKHFEFFLATEDERFFTIPSFRETFLRSTIYIIHFYYGS